MDNKRKDLNDDKALVVKKQRTEDQLVVSQQSSDRSKQIVLPPGVTRTSSLMAPIMILQGHQAEVLSIKFGPSGKHIVSGSVDKQIFLWNVYGECENYAVLKGHTNAVLEVAWAHDEQYIVSASADKSVAIWDPEEAVRIRKTHHASFVNCCSTARSGSLYVSGSDDGNIKLWDNRSKGCIQTYNAKYSVLSTSFNGDGTQILSGGIDNAIKIWDIRKGGIFLEMTGHQDTVTGIRLSPDGNYLLSNSMDNSVRIWDVRPFVKTDRCLKVFIGAQHNFEKTLLRCSWSPDGSKVSAGSADRFVYVWDTAQRKILYKLPGHKGSVNEVDFHPKEPIVASCSSDQTIYLGEILSAPATV